jgi:hypothetical protein
MLDLFFFGNLILFMKLIKKCVILKILAVTSPRTKTLLEGQKSNATRTGLFYGIDLRTSGASA